MNELDIFCDFEPIDNSETEFKCKLCNNRMQYGMAATGLPQIPCIAKLSKPIPADNIKLVPVKSPSFPKKVYNFILALVDHLRTGAKRTSKEEREHRLSICSQCEFYDGLACTKCGCPITRHQQFISKLDWKNQKCPVGKW